MASKQTKKGAKSVAATTEITLQQIVEATLDTSKGFLYVPESVYAPLVAQGLVEVNADMKDEQGNPAVRATEQGQNQMAKKDNTNTDAGSTVATGTATTYAIETGIEKPARRRGRIGGETYPFDTLEVGQSFFVPATDARPNPAKSMASTVSSATARYATQDPNGATRETKKGKTVPVMVATRKFSVMSVEGGARVWRDA